MPEIVGVIAICLSGWCVNVTGDQKFHDTTACYTSMQRWLSDNVPPTVTLTVKDMMCRRVPVIKQASKRKE